MHPKGTPGIKFTKHGLTTLVINFQSLWDKRVELSNLAHETKADIIIGTETWLVPERLADGQTNPNGHKDSELLLDGYDIRRRDRPTRGGGVLIAMKEELGGEEISLSKDSETIFCKIKIKGRKPLVIGSAYRPPSLDLEDSKLVAGEIYKIVDQFKDATFWLGGDFNVPDIDWKSQDIIGNQYSREINSIFLEMSQDLGLSQIIDVPTRGTSFLDLLFSNKPDLVRNCKLLAGLGDHEAVKVQLALHPIRKKPTKRRIHLWNKVDEAKLLQDAHTFKTKFLELFSIQDNVEDMWVYIKKEILTIIDKNVPTKMTSSKTHQPWINTETKQLIRKKNRWLKKAKNSNLGKDWDTYKKIKSSTQKTCRQTHEKYLNSIFTEDKSNKKLWSYIKSRKQQNVGIPDLKDKNKVPTNDPVQKANLIREHLDTVFSDPSPPPIQANFDEKEKLPTIQPIKITPPGIRKLLSNLNPNKANGPDNIPGNFLKLCASEMADIYTVLFQASLDQGVVPSDWKTANIVPLFKKGDKSLPENYRPISLTSLSCKILEHVVFSNFMAHFEEFNVLDNAQHGFRKKRSCVSQLIITNYNQ